MYSFARRQFEKLYNCKMTIQENKPVKEGNITKPKWVDVLVDEPCRISQKSLSEASEGTVASISYATALYCRPEIEIKSGDRIVITDVHGNVRKYKRSSEGFNSYLTHQEIVIVREESS